MLDVLVDRIDMQEALIKIEEFIRGAENRLVVTPNAEMIMAAQEDLRLKKIINRADLALPDGAGVVLAAKLLGKTIPERVAGVDLVQELFKLAEQRGYSLYFLGAAPGIAQEAKEQVRSRYSNLEINLHHGYLTRRLEEEVINDIIVESPDILLVGMGVPLQEKWLASYLSCFSGIVGIGVGGTFDILAGAKKRAPLLLQQMHLEWFYRLLQEPERIVRTAQLPKFILKVLKQRSKDTIIN